MSNELPSVDVGRAKGHESYIQYADEFIECYTVLSEQTSVS